MAKSNGARPAKGPVTLLVSTQKGGFFLKSDAGRKTWKLSGPVMLGTVVEHMVADPREPGVILMAARTGHLGPTVFRSTDNGKNWKEAAKPPAFAKAKEGEQGRTVSSVFTLTPGHKSEPGVWYAGTIPFGLFRSEDGGVKWKGVDGYNKNPKRPDWGKDADAPPGGPFTHSILVHPEDPKKIYLSMSLGGFFESVDGGKKWAPINKGTVADFLPVKEPEYGQDPHCAVMSPADPGRFYQQNHCGIYRMDRSEGRWHRVGDNMPKEIGDIGFGVIAHPRNRDTAWVFPMDGTMVWPRTSPGGKPAAYVTQDGGNSWQRQDKGLPKEHAYFTVFRQALANDTHDPVGVYFGTTSGEVWGSNDEGSTWTNLASHLPRVLAVEAVEK